MEKKFTLPAWLVLTIISIVAAISLAITNLNTRDIIKARAVEATNQAMQSLIPGAGSFESVDIEGNNVLDMFSVAKDGDKTVGYVAQLKKAGYGGPVEVLVAVDNDLQILGINVGGSEFQETAGLGSHVKDEDFQEQFIGLSAPLKFVRGAFGREKTEPKQDNLSSESESNDVAEVESQPGELKGEGDGFGGKVTVVITKDGDKITDVKITGDSETAGIGTNAIEQMPSRIIEANGADVEAVSGATITSNAIIDAANQALAGSQPGELKGEGDGFGGKVTVVITKDGDNITDVKITGDSETAGIGTNAIEQMPDRIIEANGADVEAVSGATITSNAIIDAAKRALAGSRSGELKGEGDGFGGKVIVVITKDGDKITDVKITGDSETAGIGTNAIEQMPAKIIEANGADVEAVSGATITSNAIIDAAKRALGGNKAAKKSEPDEVDGISGATVSSRAVFEAVNSALREIEKLAK